MMKIYKPDIDQENYYAFISYSHQDREYANWLHKNLERCVSSLGRGLFEQLIPNEKLVFIDTKNIQATENLSSTIIRALSISKVLIVIWSSNTFNSEWVKKEITEYSKNGKTKILGLIVDDKINPRIVNEYFQKEFKGLNIEPFIPSILKDGKRVCIEKILGGMFDENISHSRKIKIRSKLYVYIFSAFLGVLCLGMSLLLLWGLHVPIELAFTIATVIGLCFSIYVGINFFNDAPWK